MLGLSDFNMLFLSSHPEIASRFFAGLGKPKSKARRPKALVMAIKPKYAKAIYDGRKNWEFRKAPPPLFKDIYIYESAPVSKITGVVMFSESVRGCPASVYDIVKNCRAYTKNLPGISFSDLETYAGRSLVTALRVYRVRQLDHDICFDAKPPQNWGTYVAVHAQETNKGGDE